MIPFVLLLLLLLLLSKSKGHDGVSTELLKLINNDISNCITLIINQSLTSCIYPDSLKVAKVTPIYNKMHRGRVFFLYLQNVFVYKTNFLRTYSNIVLKVILNCMNMQIATQLIMMYNL